MKILVTCPPMLGMIENFRHLFEERGIELSAPDIIQTMSVDELKKIVPQHEGWIIGDDPATREVFKAGKTGKLRAAVKWGIGVDNVDFDACKDFDIPIINTPDMFGKEVADIAMGYVIALARENYEIDRAVRNGDWIKPRGISLSGKTVALVGFGDIGQSTAKRLLASDMKVIAYDPFASHNADLPEVKIEMWPNRIEEADFIVITCALTQSSYHMVNANVLEKVKNGVRVVNVGRGPIVDEAALEVALKSGKVYSAALDVFEIEPLPMDSYLRSHPHCIFGSHNASNTAEAVERTSHIAINRLFNFLKITE
jgi:D-3-phosphoglycerate dehydrogenase